MAVRKVLKRKKNTKSEKISDLPVFKGQSMPVSNSAATGTITYQDNTITVAENLGAIPSFWGVDTNTISELGRSGRVIGAQYGLLSAVPLICKGDKCPYINACFIDPAQRSYVANLKPPGRCLIEIAALVDRFNRYVDFFMITDEDVVDMSLIRELVDVEIQILRCDNLIAIDGDFIEMVVAGVSNQGREYKRPELKQSIVLKEKLRNERHRIYKLLDSTREDRAKRLKNIDDPSIKAAELVARMKELQQAGTIKTVFVTQDASVIDVSHDATSEPVCKTPIKEQQEEQQIEDTNDLLDQALVQSSEYDLDL